jgi:hypothetical protein
MERGLLLIRSMDMLQLALQLALLISPVLGAACGYLVDGVTGATSGIVIPMGPLVVAWLFGER